MQNPKFLVVVVGVHMGVCIKPETIYANYGHEKLMEHGVFWMFKHADFGTRLQQ
jgi:hypothetical protein